MSGTRDESGCHPICVHSAEDEAKACLAALARERGLTVEGAGGFAGDRRHFLSLHEVEDHECYVTGYGHYRGDL